MVHENENLRVKEIEKLRFFLNNPGYFSILVLGENGTGKEYIINKLLSESFKDLDFGVFNAFELGETESEIGEIFSNEIILIKNIEELSEIQQNILFKYLSTDSTGKVGVGKNKGYKRVIFTSAFDVAELRDNKSNLNSRFWDRISQLVVKLPSFKDFSSNIRKDFSSVWEKMHFENFNKLPEDGEFNFWLTENCGMFAGNFRDLDKIAILWHQYRIIEYGDSKQTFKSDVEARIFRKVRSDFEKFTHFPTQKSDTTNIYEFEKGKTWEQIERNFKSKFKQWAKSEYGTIKNATEEMNMPFRKMDKW